MGFGAGFGGAAFLGSGIAFGADALVSCFGCLLGRMPMSTNWTRIGPGFGREMEAMAVQLRSKMNKR